MFKPHCVAHVACSAHVNAMRAQRWQRRACLSVTVGGKSSAAPPYLIRQRHRAVAVLRVVAVAERHVRCLLRCGRRALSVQCILERCIERSV